MVPGKAGKREGRIKRSREDRSPRGIKFARPALLELSLSLRRVGKAEVSGG